jgi:2-polyprenyl-6-methoxyphenol hydroxylase-like FAD-dependent oxidoreductase
MRIHVNVFERDPSRAVRLPGHRVGVDQLGTRALRNCLPTDTFKLFLEACGRTPRYLNYLTEQMQELLSLDLEDFGVGRSTTRMTLRQVLMTGLEDRVHFGKTFLQYTEEEDGKVTAHFLDGSTVTADLIVGADGAGSRVRRQLLPHAVIEETGIIGIAGKAPLNEQTRALLPEKVQQGVTLISAPKGFVGVVHVLSFDNSGQYRDERADFLERWPGMKYDDTEDCIAWAVWGSKWNWPADTTVMWQDAAEVISLALTVTHDWHPNLRALIGNADLSSVLYSSIRSSVPVKPWDYKPITILGDAIHQMTPGRGAGANTALRDAELLAGLLGEVARGSRSLRDAVVEYERQMLEYGFDAVAESRKHFDGRSLMHRPVFGSVLLSVIRAGMRIVNAAPPLKNKITNSYYRFHGKSV